MDACHRRVHLLLLVAGSFFAGCVDDSHASTLPPLDSRTEQRRYEGEYLTGIDFPIGGIGTGQIFINGYGERSSYYIWDSYAAKPNPFAGLVISWKDGEWHALQGKSIGRILGASRCVFRAEYPFCWIDLSDDNWPVKVRLRVWNPMILFNERDSAIPCAITNVIVTNVGSKRLNVKLCSIQQNPFEIVPGRKAPLLNESLSPDKNPVAHMSSLRDSADEGYGDMALACLGKSSTAHTDIFQFDPFLARDMLLREEGKQGAFVAVETSLKVAPRKTAEASYVLSWSLPNDKKHFGTSSYENYWAQKTDLDWKTTAVGNKYNVWWKDAIEVTEYVRENYAHLLDKTDAYHDALYSSDLPRWLLDGLSANIATLRSPTCFWNRDGYFGALEGQRETQHYRLDSNCTHVIGYAQTYAYLYPAIARNMRESELKFTLKEGFIPHRQSGYLGHFGAAFDGQCFSILSVYRELLMSKDTSWFMGVWPTTKRALDALLAWDGEELDGIFEEPQWTTMDGNVNGTTTWMGSLYLAALAAGEEMAKLTGDKDAANKYKSVREVASKTEDELLFDGEYYIQKLWDKPKAWKEYKIPYNAAGRFDGNEIAYGAIYGDGCHIDQLLGQWWGGSLGLGDLYPPDHMQSAIKSILKYNFHKDLSVLKPESEYFSPGDPGVQMISYPKTKLEKEALYSSQAWTGCEYAYAGLLIQRGMVDEGLRVAQCVRARYDGRLRPTWRFAAGGNPFAEVEWGRFYMRSMSMWPILTSIQGFKFDGPRKLVGFDPVWKPNNHRSFFTYPDGFGMFSQKRSHRALKADIVVKGGEISLKTVRLGIPAPGAKSVKVFLNDKPIEAVCKGADVCLASEINLRSQDRLTVDLRF